MLVSLGIRNSTIGNGPIACCAEDFWHNKSNGNSNGNSNSNNDQSLDCRNKTERIERCLFGASSNTVDLWELRELALSDGGLVRAGYRRKAWPKLVGLVEDETSIDMIRRDAGRSVIFRYHNEYENETQHESESGYESERKSDRPLVPPCASKRLARVLENTIRHGNSSLHYYQGLHDIAGVLLHNMDYQVDATTHILQRISRSHLRDAMRENFANINWLLSVLLPPLVEKVDPYVHYALQLAQVELSTVCLPWMITWFTHDIHDPETAGRLVDAFLSGHPLMPIYFSVALITHPFIKQELLAAESEDAPTIFMAIKGTPQRLRTRTSNGDILHPQQNKHISLQEVLEDCITIM
eukprot:jgi/Psemu1/208178/e_gw1.460.42.1